MSFNITSGSYFENSGLAFFTVSRTHSGFAETVLVSTFQNYNGNGVFNNSDYSGFIDFQVPFGTTETSKSFQFNLTPDSNIESDETFGLLVENLNQATLAFTSFTILNDDTAPSPEITVLGNGVSIADDDTIPSSADHTDFGGATQGGAAVQRTFTVRNDGTGTLTTSNLTLPSGFSVVEGLSSSITAGNSDTFTVQLDTGSTGTKAGNIVFLNNDANENVFVFGITGTVNAVPSPEIAVSGSGANIADGDLNPISTDGTDFGTVAQGTTVDRVFTVSNTGTGTLTTSGLTPPSGFTVVEGLSPSITAGNSDTFTVRLNTSSTGTKSGQITFNTNDSDEAAFNFQITGTVNAGPTPPLLTANQIFSAAGTNQLEFMAHLANAAYGSGGLSSLTSFNTVNDPLQLFNAADLGAAGLNLSNGMYINGDGAALVGRSSDALFIAFRGTDGLGDWLPDNFWMSTHYALFRPLIDALHQYLVGANGIEHVYVTGHSLGAAMAQAYMLEYSLLPNFEAILFANPGYGVSGTVAGHITNLWVESDPIRGPAFVKHIIGDGNVIGGDLHGDQSITEIESHKMALYLSYTELFQQSGINVDQLRLLHSVDYDSVVANALVDNINNETVFFAGLGPDSSALFGGDPLVGGLEPDLIFGGTGDDDLDGGAGDRANDRLYGGADNDTYHFYRNSGDDTVIDSQGIDTIYYHGNAFDTRIAFGIMAQTPLEFHCAV